jgi:hypothetical protein
MSSYSNVFGKYLKAKDLNGKAAGFTIKKVEEVEFDDGKILSLELEETKKIFLCNRTNGDALAALLGDEMDSWSGKRITLIPGETRFSGRVYPTIYVKAPKNAFVTSIEE